MSAKKQKRAKKNKNQSVLVLFGLCRPHRLWSGCQVSSEIALSLSINTLRRLLLDPAPTETSWRFPVD